jgi:hypothetical protein
MFSTNDGKRSLKAAIFFTGPIQMYDISKAKSMKIRHAYYSLLNSALWENAMPNEPVNYVSKQYNKTAI